MAERGATPGARMGLVLSCEHGGRRVPARWRALFEGRERLLASHRGQDNGAAGLATLLGRALGTRLLLHDVTRLLVDPNRSLHDAGVFSEWTRALPAAQRERLVETLWRPHRARVRDAVGQGLARHELVFHLGVHSFTPVLRGRRRPMHIGLLYDPRRAREAALARRWQREIGARLPRLVVARNAPYRGDSDGLTTTLRAELGERYLGLELEVRSDRLREPHAREVLAAALADSLRAAWESPRELASARRARSGPQAGRFRS